MTPIDPTSPVLPSHLVRRPDGRKGRRREPVPGEKSKRKPKLPPEHDSGDDHLIDTLA